MNIQIGPFRLYRSDIGFNTPYMERWILDTPWGTLRLHHILRSDDDKACHDHPFAFSSLLTGGYTEFAPAMPLPVELGGSAVLADASEADVYQCVEAMYRRSDAVVDYVKAACDGPFVERHFPRFSVVRRPARYAHRLILERPIWTLVLTSPKERSWGFYLPDEGFVPWRMYFARFGSNDEIDAYVRTALGR